MKTTSSPQLRTRRMMVAVTAGCITAVLGTAVQQIADHGWRAFIFRPPGVGATHDRHHGRGATPDR